MKITATILLLVGCLFAQVVQDTSAAGSPMTFSDTVDAKNIVARNVSNKEILAFSIKFSSAAAYHDYYFKPDGIVPGASETITLDFPQAQGRVAYIQFVDGSEWGDITEASHFLTQRPAALQVISQMVDAYAKGGEKGIVALLNANPTSKDEITHGLAIHFQTMLAESGIDGVIFHLKSRLASAAAHDKTLHR
jgi:hypothetical protein